MQPIVKITALLMLFAVGKAFADQPIDEIAQLTAVEIATEIRQGNLSSAKLVDHYLSRISEHNESGAALHAVISLNPLARQQAGERDRMVASGRILGRLHGVPVLVKDSIDVAGLPTTAGSLALAANVAERDAPVIARLRAEGAIILGKTNLSEWSNFRSRSAPAGWSAVGGQTANPFSEDHSPCGSSSGSAVAIAADFAPLTIGAETNGSLVCPGAVNGVAAFKPTVGRLSQEGMIVVSDFQDTVGPMAHSVADLALAMDVMLPVPEQAERQFNRSDVTAFDLDGVRIGVFRWAEGNHPAVSRAFNAAVDTLESAGAVMVEISTFDPDPVMWQKGNQVLWTDLAGNLTTYLEATPDAVEVKSIESLLAFNEEEPAEKTGEYGQDILERVLASREVPPDQHAEAVATIRKASRENGMDLLLAEHRVDVLIMPTAPPAAPRVRDEETARLRRNIGATWLPAMAGYPMLTVPMGSADGLPLGLGITGTANDDTLVLGVGFAFEKAADISLRPEL